MKLNQKGFALDKLMITIAITSIFVVIMISSYFNHKNQQDIAEKVLTGAYLNANECYAIESGSASIDSINEAMRKRLDSIDDMDASNLSGVERVIYNKNKSYFEGNLPYHLPRPRSTSDTGILVEATPSSELGGINAFQVKAWESEIRWSTKEGVLSISIPCGKNMKDSLNWDGPRVWICLNELESKQVACQAIYPDRNVNKVDIFHEKCK